MLRDNSQRAKNAIIFFWVLFGITAVGMISTYMEYALAQRALNTTINIDEANANDNRQRIIKILVLVTHILTIVYFIMWFRRAYYNLHALRCYPHYSEGWAAGAWFVPFLNLVRPYEIMREIWVRTQERAQQETADPVIKSASTVGWWWFLWLATNVVATIYAWTVNGDSTLKAVIARDSTAIFIDGFQLINILFTITIIRNISGFEEKLKDVISIENITFTEPASPVSSE